MPFPRLLLATLVLAISAAPERATAQGQAGTVAGTVTLSRSIANRRVRFRIYSEPGKGATPSSQPAPDLREEFANVVMYLELDGGKIPVAGLSPHPERPAMRQKDERFLPHVLPIVQGTTVEFPNDDDIFHNVFSLSAPRRFDLPKYPAGSSRSVTFPRAGVVNVFCHIHPDMSAVVLVLENPFFTTPAVDGRFSLAGVPPGDYVLVAWHERIKPIRMKVKVVAGQTTTMNFNIPLPQPADH